MLDGVVDHLGQNRDEGTSELLLSGAGRRHLEVIQLRVHGLADKVVGHEDVVQAATSEAKPQAMYSLVSSNLERRGSWAQVNSKGRWNVEGLPLRAKRHERVRATCNAAPLSKLIAPFELL